MARTSLVLKELPDVGQDEGLWLELRDIMEPAMVQEMARAYRLGFIIAVLEKRGGYDLSSHDIFVNVVGGLRLDEPAVDLGLGLAIISSLLDMALDPHTVAVGEIGLGGEVRHVQQLEQRVREAARLGFTRVICPRTKMKPPANCKLIPVSRLEQAMEHLT